MKYAFKISLFAVGHYIHYNSGVSLKTAVGFLGQKFLDVNIA